MAKASDNVFPKVIVSEGSAPAAAASGQQKLFIDSADHKLKRINSGGTVTTVEGGSGSGTYVYPPGSFDKPPASPNAKDDEYDGTSTVTWTATPTAANAKDRNSTRADHLYIKAASGNASHLVGEYQAIPGSFPFTVTSKVVSTTGRQAFHRAGGLYFAPASPTTSSAVVYFGSVYNSSAPAGMEIVRITYTNDSTFGSQSTFVGQRAGLPMREYYLKAVFTSATAASLYYSSDGYAWILAEAYTFGFTVANMGVAQAEETANTGVEAFYGFFRVS